MAGQAVLSFEKAVESTCKRLRFNLGRLTRSKSARNGKVPRSRILFYQFWRRLDWLCIHGRLADIMIVPDRVCILRLVATVFTRST